jgi:hypothetical protein
VNPLSLILGFLPLIAFAVLSGRVADNGAAWAATVACAIAVVLLVIKRTWPPKLVDAFQALVFAVIAVIGFAGGNDVDAWLFDWANGLTTTTLGVLILAFVPVLPFTEQYARESVPQEYWGEPTFERVNRNLSLLLGRGARRHGAEQPGRGVAAVTRRLDGGREPARPRAQLGGPHRSDRRHGEVHQDVPGPGQGRGPSRPPGRPRSRRAVLTGSF